MIEVFMDIETTGLNPLESRIISVGFMDIGERPVVYCDEDEKLILKNSWFYLNSLMQKDRIKLIGYNLVSFDYHFMKIRSMLHGIQVTPIDSYDMNDLFWCLNQPYTNNRVKLETWCKFLGIPHDFTLNGSMMPELFEKKNYDAIRKHNIDDLVSTKLLYERVKNAGLHKFRAGRLIY